MPLTPTPADSASAAESSPPQRPDLDQMVDHDAEPQLQRHLTNRHVQLIAIGGAIGTGLFMGSGKTIALAGPGVFLVYTIIGFFLFLVMRALGEVLLSNLSYKSFADVAHDLIGPWAGFFVGWTYYVCWLVTAVVEVIVITGYMDFWWPDLPRWIMPVVTVVLLFFLNLATVKAFGEIEFWFSIIKIVAIMALVAVGVVMVVMGFTAPNGAHAQISNIWSGGVFPKGASGFFGAFQIAIFAFVGTELVGTAAAEAKDPEVTLPRAINAIPMRIVLFYLGALAAIMAVTPWREINPEDSPFVAMFSLAGLGVAAGLVNFVVLTAAASSTNSGVYSTSRMLFGLSWAGNAPHVFRRLTARSVPGASLVFTCAFLLTSIPLLYTSQSIIAAFTKVTSVAIVLFILVWCIIVVSYLRFRSLRPELHEASAFRLPGGRVTAWLSLAFFAFVIWTLTLAHDTRIAVFFAAPLWLVTLGVAWLVHSSRLARHQEPQP
ncbi:amino acid permease [Actinomyces sp. HMSC075C01]|uniref:amino acid permease n=1 Tax=Actinomyces sp. HMSC075C01 TaxID=1739387 RepID=UPI000A623E8A|nr:amino acid permease [Actinomyces sp. HMSC075C01]